MARIDIDDSNRRSVGREAPGDRLSDAAPSTRDDGHLAIQPKILRITARGVQREIPRFQGIKSS